MLRYFDMQRLLLPALMLLTFGCEPGGGTSGDSDSSAGATSAGATMMTSSSGTSGAQSASSTEITSDTTNAAGSSTGAPSTDTASTTTTTDSTGSTDSTDPTGAMSTSSGGETTGDPCEPEWPPGDPYGPCEAHNDCLWGACQVMIGYSRCVPTATPACDNLFCPPGPNGPVFPNAGNFPPICEPVCLGPEDCAEGAECLGAQCWWPQP